VQDGNGASPARIEEDRMVVAELDGAEKTPAQLFRYSTWLHVGAGAEQCEDVDEQAGEVTCANPLHFHAWCRLINQFQHREIREKALAARARRVRQLRDPTSDSRAILEDDIDTIVRQPGALDALVDELVDKDFLKDYFEARRDLHEFEDEHGERPWQTIEQDRARYEQLKSLDEAERPSEEFTELENHLLAHAAAASAAHDAIREPKRQALAARDINDLADMVREQRIAQEGQAEFNHIYSSWQWYVGTLRTPGGPRRFESMEAMEAAAPEVIEALGETFSDLERTFDEGPTKNS
jgi:hypothetical protein